MNDSRRTQSCVELTSSSGYTFLEMMMAFSIFGILIVIVYSTFFSQYRSFNNQQSMIQLSSDATNIMRDVKEVLEDYGSLTIQTDQIRSSGTTLIDMRDDGSNDGTMLNLSNNALFDDTGYKLADHIDAVSFYLGPGNISGYGIDDGVLLIVVTMKDHDITFVLKGGVNLVK